MPPACPVGPYVGSYRRVTYWLPRPRCKFPFQAAIDRGRTESAACFGLGCDRSDLAQFRSADDDRQGRAIRSGHRKRSPGQARGVRFARITIKTCAICSYSQRLSMLNPRRCCRSRRPGTPTGGWRRRTRARCARCCPGRSTARHRRDEMQVGLPPEQMTPAELEAGLATPSTVQLSPNIRSPRILQTSIGVEHRWNRNTSLSVEYEHQRGNHLFRGFDLNAPLPPQFIRPNSNFAEANSIRADGTSKRNSLNATFRTRVSISVLIRRRLSLSLIRSRSRRSWPARSAGRPRGRVRSPTPWAR